MMPESVSCKGGSEIRSIVASVFTWIPGTSPEKSPMVHPIRENAATINISVGSTEALSSLYRIYI